jgi:hypothetical protein
MLDFAGHFALTDLPGNAYDCTDDIEMKTSRWTTHGASGTAPAVQDVRGMNFTAPER